MSDVQPPPQRHSRHYATQLLTLQVDDRLFRIPDNVLRGSSYFSDMLDSDHIGKPGEGASDENPIVLHGITADELEGFLDAPLARLGDHSDSVETLNIIQLSSTLHLATMWSFDRVREYAIHLIDEHFPNPADRIELSFKCDVKRWRLPAYRALCEREVPLNGTEAIRIGAQRLAAICRVRERRLRIQLAGSGYRCGVCSNCQAGHIATYCQKKNFDIMEAINAEVELVE